MYTASNNGWELQLGLSPRLLLPSDLIFTHFSESVVVCHCGLTCISLTTNDVEIFCMCLLTTFKSSFGSIFYVCVIECFLPFSYPMSLEKQRILIFIKSIYHFKVSLFYTLYKKSLLILMLCWFFRKSCFLEVLLF